MSNYDNQKIMHVRAGHLPPDDLLEHILSKKPNAFGFAVQNVDKGQPDLSIIREDATNINLTELKQLFLNAKDFPLSVYFAKLAAEYNPDDIQPIILNDGGDNPFMALFMEGTINGNDSPVNRTEQFNVINGIIMPTILDWCETYEGDLDKIMAKIKGSVFEKNVMAHIGHRGVLHILPLEGDQYNIGNNTIGLDGDWGWISQKDGYGEAPIVVEEPVAEKKRGFWKGGGAAATAAKASVPASPVKDAATPGTAEREIRKAPEMAAKPPSWCHKNDDVKMWYNIVGNEEIGQLKSVVPAAWKKRLPIIVKNHTAIKIDNLKDFTDYALKRTLQTTGATATSAGPVPSKETVAASEKKAITGVAGDVELPIIGPRELEAVLETVSKIDSNSKKIADPKEMQAQETAYPLFSEAVGVTADEMLNWPVSGLFAIGKTDFRAAVLMAVQFRNLYRNLKNGTVVNKTDKSVTTITSDGSTVKVESVLTEAPLVAKKKTFWGAGKKAA